MPELDAEAFEFCCEAQPGCCGDCGKVVYDSITCFDKCTAEAAAISACEILC